MRWSGTALLMDQPRLYTWSTYALDSFTWSSYVRQAAGVSGFWAQSSMRFGTPQLDPLGSDREEVRYVISAPTRISP